MGVNMLKLGEKIIYEASSGFELSSISKLAIGEKKIYITNLGNIIIEDKSNFFKKGESKYYYNYSEYKQKLTARLEGSLFIVYGNDLPFDVSSENISKSDNYDLLLKLSFEDFKYIYKNQREFIIELEDNQSIFKLDNDDLLMGNISRKEDRFTFKNVNCEFDIYIKDIEKYYIDERELNLKGYFYIKNKDEVIKDIYIFTNKKDLLIDLEDKTKNNKKIGNLPEDSCIAYGQLCGTINEVDHKRLEIFLVKYSNQLLFINKESKNVVTRAKVDECFKLRLDEDVILYDNDNIFTIKISDKNICLLELDKLCDIDNEDIGYTINKTPFFINHNQDFLSLHKSAKKEMLSIKNNDIKDIVINNLIRNYNDNFTEIEIMFSNRKITINLRNSIIQKLMRDVFVYSKKPMVKNVSIKNLYGNWAKSTNDMILFNFFGNLYYMKMEIDNILKKEITDEDRVNIVNMLYYQIQDQRNQFDVLCAYMPKSIEHGEIKLFNEFNVPIDKKVFRILQKQLFGLASQINRHLADIEKSLSQLSFVIYSEFNTREFSNNVKNKQVGIGLAASVASSIVLGGGLSVPFLAMQGMSLYSNKKMDDKMKEIEGNKLNLFTNQAINKLNHLVDTMYPYYISEANDTLFDLFNILSKEYAKHSDDKVKDVLFDRITDIYVCKQMTLNNMTNMRKKDLINEIYKSIDNSMNTLDANMFLIGGIN